MERKAIPVQEMDVEQVRKEIVPALELIFQDIEVGNAFTKHGVKALREKKIPLSPSAEAFLEQVDLRAAEEAIQAMRKETFGAPGVGPRALVVGFPVVAVVMKGARKPGR